MIDEDEGQVLLEIALGVRDPVVPTQKVLEEQTASTAVIEGSEESPTDRQSSVVSVSDGAPAGRSIVEVDPARCSYLEGQPAVLRAVERGVVSHVA